MTTPPAPLAALMQAEAGVQRGRPPAQSPESPNPEAQAALPGDLDPEAIFRHCLDCGRPSGRFLLCDHCRPRLFKKRDKRIARQAKWRPKK